jgi:hypothetical protein
MIPAPVLLVRLESNLELASLALMAGDTAKAVGAVTAARDLAEQVRAAL